MPQHTWREVADFIVGFLRDPRKNGSIIPSSPSLTKAMLAGLPWPNIATLVELGPGVGTFTAAIVGQIRADAKIILVEVDPIYAEHLRNRYGERVSVESASAADLDAVLARHGIDCPDCIISGLPLASLPKEVSERIAAHIRHYIGRGATYRSFTYRPAKTMKFFGDGVLEYRSSWILSNFPPAFVLGAN